MLDPQERAAVAAAFGVADVQVERDHLISHLLVALAREAADDVIFFGGTALARTHLPQGRLSEDIDLLAVGSRRAVVDKVQRVLVAGARRSHGRLVWAPPLGDVQSEEHGVLVSPDGLAMRVQLLDPVGRAPWPTEVRAMVLRYSDVGEARLTVPTLAGFVAAKTSAWFDRRAPRDLFDLNGLAELGAIDRAAAQLFTDLGPTGGRPAPWMFDRPPAEDAWTAELSAQTRLSSTAREACANVERAWAATETIDDVPTAGAGCDDRDVGPRG